MHKNVISANYKIGIVFALLLFEAMFPPAIKAAPKPELWSIWAAYNPASSSGIDHRAWGGFLSKYLVTGDPSGVNLIRYADVSPQDKKLLEGYLKKLQETKVSELNRAEQEAYWINLYNALTVKVVLDHYPVKSIRDIDISPGWLSIGPWGAKLLNIEGQMVSLDDIEHRILRPIWKDNRIHYGVNCASIGCPNLQPEPFTAENTNKLLDKGAREYVNSPRGVRIQSDRLTLSSIYNWFQVDFGGSEQGVIEHLLRYAAPPLAEKLRNFKGKIEYHYDWNLNDYTRINWLSSGNPAAQGFSPAPMAALKGYATREEELPDEHQLSCSN